MADCCTAVVMDNMLFLHCNLDDDDDDDEEDDDDDDNDF